MNQSSNKNAVLVGLFVLVGIVFLVAGVLMIGNLHDTFKSKIQIVSLFTDVSGLQKGNNVWFSGVKIGIVSSMDFYGRSQVAVKLKIETKVQQYIRKDARVKVSSDGLIGNKILVIYGGTAQSETIKEGDKLKKPILPMI
jgi:phospholipid/cholesterol/gamma-HCH transport system substrate-binding protein